MRWGLKSSHERLKNLCNGNGAANHRPTKSNANMSYTVKEFKKHLGEMMADGHYRIQFKDGRVMKVRGHFFYKCEAQGWVWDDRKCASIYTIEPLEGATK